MTYGSDVGKNQDGDCDGHLEMGLNGFLEVLVEEEQRHGEVLALVSCDELLEVCGVAGQVADGLGMVFDELLFEVLCNLWVRGTDM